MKRLILFTTLALVVSSATAVSAQELLADANKDGKVTAKEYQDSRRNFLMRADRDRDGKISQAEWKRGANLEREQLRANGANHTDLIGKGGWFTTLDLNKDGFVAPTEIDTVSANRFPKFDLNHDGGVSRSEAVKLDAQASKRLK